MYGKFKPLGLYICYLFRSIILFGNFCLERTKRKKIIKRKKSGFWGTVFKVEIADIAFAVDSILAAVALAMTLPNTNLPNVGGMDGGKFLVVFTGGLIGLIIMRFAANIFVKLLQSRPGLEIAAFAIVGWVGVKLAVLTLGHDAIRIIPHDFAHSTEWKLIFYVVLILIAAAGWFLTGTKKKREKEKLA